MWKLEEREREGKGEEELIKRRIAKEKRRIERAKRKGYFRSLKRLGTEIGISFLWNLFRLKRNERESKEIS